MKRMDLIEIVPDIFRFTVPYKDIFTTVFVIRSKEGVILFDTASCDEDVRDYVIPALKELEVTADMLKYVVISHSHNDHAGGLFAVLEAYPDVCVISKDSQIKEKFSSYQILDPEEGKKLSDDFMIVTVPGHSPDCISLLDLRTKTLLTGDCLQLYGIYGSGSWGANIGMAPEHMKALDKLAQMDLETVIASHVYHSKGYLAQGKSEIKGFLQECKDALYRIRTIVAEHQELEAESIREICNRESELPVVGLHVIINMRKAIAEDRF